MEGGCQVGTGLENRVPITFGLGFSEDNGERERTQDRALRGKWAEGREPKENGGGCRFGTTNTGKVRFDKTAGLTEPNSAEINFSSLQIENDPLWILDLVAN
jgi:hypothetical protein